MPMLLFNELYRIYPIQIGRLSHNSTGMKRLDVLYSSSEFAQSLAIQTTGHINAEEVENVDSMLGNSKYFENRSHQNLLLLTYLFGSSECTTLIESHFYSNGAKEGDNPFLKEAHNNPVKLLLDLMLGQFGGLEEQVPKK